jgi:hypothetical protein
VRLARFAFRTLAIAACAACAACARREPADDRAPPNETVAGASASAVAGAAPDERPAPPAVPLAAPPPAGDVERARIDSLDRSARALAHTDGCASADQCRAAPLGLRACGGPRDFVAYCARSTDTVALFHALGALERAERAYDVKHGVASTCELRVAPLPGLVAGRCSAGGATAGPR